MDPHAWAKAKSLLAAAADLPAADRGAFLEMHCSDAALRAELIAMLQTPAALSEITRGARALQPGTELGSYRVEQLLGRGGMGEVYKARDTRLERDVAIKLLPAAVSDDPERLRRFHQEAHILAALNHPHIATIYGLEECAGLRLLIMECIDGPSLAERLADGPLSIAEALHVSIAIAEALDAAHRAGIVHRDLKPANIMLGPTGPKLLDFGLARARRRDAPTEVTADGTILGTLHYMAPEQVEGRRADARSDIFAFGCVLYEMVSGRRAFDASSQAGIVAAILQTDPDPLSAIRTDAPPALEHVVARCLAKDADARWQTTRDLLEELRWVGAGGSTKAIRWRWRSALVVAPWVLAGVAVSATLLASRWPRETGALARGSAVRTVLEPPDGFTFGRRDGGNDLALSPDGSRIAFRAMRGGTPVMWVQTLATGEAAPVANTGHSSDPFFSSDGRQIGLCERRALRTVDLVGGTSVTLVEGETCVGGTWAGTDTILYASEGAIRAVPAAGGAARLVLSPFPPVVTFSNPTPLPDGRHFLVAGDTTKYAGTGVYVGDIAGHDAARLVVESLSPATYVPPGYLIFRRQQQLLAQPFDLRTQTVSGTPTVLATNVGAFAANNTGMIAYFENTSVTELIWVSRSGARLGQIGAPNEYLSPRLSPDGLQLAYGLRFDAETPGLWVRDLARESDTRLSSQIDGSPVWSGDGAQLAFDRSFEGVGIRPLTGSGDQILLRRPWVWPSDWSRDGRYLAYTYDERNIIGVWQLSPGLDLKLPLDDRAANWDAHFSPDGRWLSYTSDEGGRDDVDLVDFPRATRKWLVSKDGGAQGRWRRDGRELFYVSPDGRMMSVSVDGRGAKPGLGKAVPLFAVPIADRVGTAYDVTADGQKFIVNARPAAPRLLHVLSNWMALLGRDRR